jgi:uncharacterized protein YbjT (DUF2867 family)
MECKDMETILVTGAAGQARGDDAAASRRVQQGGTGRSVTQELLKLGYEVRAFVRVDDDRAAELRDLGAEVHVGNLLNIEEVAPVLKGVHRAYFNYPVRGGMPEAAAVFAAAAREAGVQRVVDVSMIYAGNGAGITPHMQRHWVAEQSFSAAVPEAVHINAAVFYENMAVALANGAGKELPLPLGSPDTEVPLVGSADVVRSALSLLTADEVDTESVMLISEVPSIAQVAETFGVPYVDVDDAEWRKLAKDLYQDPTSIEHLTSLWAMFKALGSGTGLFPVTADAIEKLTGHPALSLREFAATR